jgi:hypothetical protein
LLGPPRHHILIGWDLSFVRSTRLWERGRFNNGQLIREDPVCYRVVHCSRDDAVFTETTFGQGKRSGQRTANQLSTDAQPSRPGLVVK